MAEDPCATVLMPHFVMHESTQSRVYRTIGGIVISVISQIVSCWDSARVCYEHWPPSFATWGSEMGEGGNHLIPRLMILIELYLSLSSRDLYCLRMRAVLLRQPKYDLQMHRAVPRSFVFLFSYRAFSVS